MVKFSLFAFFLTTFSLIFGNVVEEGLKQVSMHDRACMSAFFDDAVRMDQIGHVLHFESKPISIIAKILKAKDRRFNDILCLKGWYAFKKNEHLFPHPNFIFSESIVDFKKDFKVLHIYLINKKSLAICLDKHMSFFKKNLGPEFDSKLFIKALEEGCSLCSLIHKNEALLGILLGFGEESSKAFLNFNEESPPESYCCIDIKSPKKCKIQPVVFMGNPESQEVKALSKVYEDELETITKIYPKKSRSLKIILEKLCEK